MLFPFGEQVTLHRRSDQPTGRDGDGNDTYDWANHTLDGCAFWPVGSVEVVQGRDRVTDTDTVAVPPESLPVGVDAIRPVDEITRAGLRYQIEGTPVSLTSPFTGKRWPIAVRLGRVVG